MTICIHTHSYWAGLYEKCGLCGAMQGREAPIVEPQSQRAGIIAALEYQDRFDGYGTVCGAAARDIIRLHDALETAIGLLWEHCEGIAPRIEPLEAALAAGDDDHLNTQVSV